MISRMKAPPEVCTCFSKCFCWEGRKGRYGVRVRDAGAKPAHANLLIDQKHINDEGS
jgi:hypothetical protein